MPARIISSKIPNLSVPGPTVHTIFVRFIFPPMKAISILNLSFLIIVMLVKAIYYCTSTEPSPNIASIALMDSSLGSKHMFGGKLMRFR